MFMYLTRLGHSSSYHHGNLGSKSICRRINGPASWKLIRLCRDEIHVEFQKAWCRHALV